MRLGPLHIVFLSASVLAAPGSFGAFAAPEPLPTSLPPGASRVDQGTTDTGPLRSSLRVIQPNLRMPQNFGDVYSFRDRDGKMKYARVSGGVTAVFDSSEYVDTSRGTFPLIPASTVFHLGSLRSFNDAAPPAANYVSPNFAVSNVSSIQSSVASTRIDATRPDGAAALAITRVAPSPTRSEPEREPPAWGMLSNESYRRSRVRELLGEAAAAKASAQATIPSSSAQPSAPAATVQADAGSHAVTGAGTGVLRKAADADAHTQSSVDSDASRPGVH